MPYCFITLILKTALRFRILLLIRPFSFLGSWHRIFDLHVLPSCASSKFTPVPFVSFLRISLTSVSVFLYFGVHPLPFSIFSLLHLVQHLSLASHLCLPHRSLLLFLHSSLSQYPCLTSIHYNRSDGGLILLL